MTDYSSGGLLGPFLCSVRNIVMKDGAWGSITSLAQKLWLLMSFIEFTVLDR